MSNSLLHCGLTLMLPLRSITASLAVAILALSALLSPAAQAASSSKAFTLSNSGNGPMTISGAVISGNTAEFALTGNTCASVAPGASCALTVTFTPNGSDARQAAALNFNSNGTNGQGHSIPLTGAGAPSEITRIISANATDVNMAALFGNPVAAGTYVLTINSGVYVTASSTALAALTTGTFPAGSTVKIANNGYLLGRGGAGGNSRGGAGGAGGVALSVATPLSLDNTNGVIGGGGGGGGAGGSTTVFCNSFSGGGGGAYAGAGGASPYPGTAGGVLTGGAGGVSGCQSSGGAGGGTGAPGASGAATYIPGGAGGQPGVAIQTNGNSLTWLGGNNSTQLKGPLQ